MTVLKFLMVVLYVFACGVLIFVVLLQQGRGASMGATLGGGASETLFGSRTGNFITRMTAVMAAVYMILALVLAKYPPFREDSSSEVRDILQPEEVQPAPAEEAAPGAVEGAAPIPVPGTTEAGSEAVDQAAPPAPGGQAEDSPMQGRAGEAADEETATGTEAGEPEPALPASAP